MMYVKVRGQTLCEVRGQTHTVRSEARGQTYCMSRLEVKHSVCKSRRSNTVHVKVGG